ncbi:hypothetical protein Bca101_046668 [Brassica carinata]
MVRLRSHHTSRAQRNPLAEHQERQGTVAIFLLKLESGGAGNPYQQFKAQHNTMVVVEKSYQEEVPNDKPLYRLFNLKQVREVLTKAAG